MTTPKLAGGARFGVRQLAAAFQTASSLAVGTQAVGKRDRHEQARCMKTAASRRTPKRLRRPQARWPSYRGLRRTSTNPLRRQVLSKSFRRR